MQGGTQQRDGVDLVPCTDCKGNVRLKVAREAAIAPAGPRITVVENVYYEQPDRQTIGVDAGFDRRVATPEQPYVRQLRVGPDWAPLDLAWVATAGVGHIVIANDEGRHFDKIPTAEQRAAVERLVIEVSLSMRADRPADWEVPPRESMRGTPLRPLFVRCRAGGTARCTVSAFPR